MALAARNPFTILLWGPYVTEDQSSAPPINLSEAVTPGHLVEHFDDSGTPKIRKNSSATEQPELCIALEQDYLNKGIDDAYAAGERPRIAWLNVGSVFYGLIASGQNIQIGERLQSAGNGTLKTATATTADANLTRFMSLDGPGAVTVSTRIRVQVIC